MPGFEANGKGDITLIQVLTHQGGFPNADVPKEAWEDHELLRRVVCDFTLEWTPGTRMHYHGRAAHWTAAVLIEALTKQDYRDVHPRRTSSSRWASPVSCSWACRTSRASGRSTCTSPSADGGEDARRAEENNADFRRAGTPGGGGYATARAMAAFYQMMVPVARSTACACSRRAWSST